MFSFIGKHSSVANNWSKASIWSPSAGNRIPNHSFQPSTQTYLFVQKKVPGTRPAQLADLLCSDFDPELFPHTAYVKLFVTYTTKVPYLIFCDKMWQIEKTRECRERTSLHFLILSPFLFHFLIISPFPHSLSISSSFSHSRSIFSQPGCQAATSCATLPIMKTLKVWKFYWGKNSLLLIFFLLQPWRFNGWNSWKYLSFLFSILFLRVGDS